MDTVFLTADLHLGHANIITYCRRPFAGPDEMDAAMIAAWNDVVGETDEVLVLGDVALGTIRDTLPLIDRLAGRKILVPGNHDRCWAGNRRRVHEWRRAYLAAGFAEIVDGPVVITLAGREVLAGHFPYHGDSQDLDRFVEERPRDDGRWLVHGHVHDTWRQHGRMINVGVDGWAGRPVHHREIEALIEAGEHDLAPLPWTGNG